ncbi:MAG: hypothetical protein CM1200mP12_15630 [Gammaproteobacteria bacterium]|nr:MAG: hypothetical protein CM1200mP12_15630 [Gammaproteobacteria bacterium]
MGYNEVITYSFIDQSLAELVGEKKKQLIFVENPISQNMNFMRAVYYQACWTPKL